MAHVRVVVAWALVKFRTDREEVNGLALDTLDGNPLVPSDYDTEQGWPL